jgi:hypothetical protein
VQFGAAFEQFAPLVSQHLSQLALGVSAIADDKNIDAAKMVAPANWQATAPSFIALNIVIVLQMCSAAQRPENKL